MSIVTKAGLRCQGALQACQRRMYSTNHQTDTRIKHIVNPRFYSDSKKIDAEKISQNFSRDHGSTFGEFFHNLMLYGGGTVVVIAVVSYGRDIIHNAAPEKDK
jgi:predicted helicase